MPTSMKYCEYFDVNEKYFPCIDESAINGGVAWDDTYPHSTFIELLDYTEKMLGGATKRSLWIHGGYGTGKSKCAYALKKILEVPEDELREYWAKFDGLKKQPALLEKLIGYKEQGILTAYRYASGNISSPQQLFMAVQESIQKELSARGLYKGENTLKECVIAWLRDSANNRYINQLLEEPKWSSVFSQSTADEIINSLTKSSDVSTLMGNIFQLASERGITALSLSSDSLRSWILDVLYKNKIKIVFIWDEFSDYFRQNKNSLGEFQKIVSICQEAPFYFVVVTHPITSLSSADESWKIVQQRFDKIEISLPDNIAFELIGAAFGVKEVARPQWIKMTDDLNQSVVDSRHAVMKAAGIDKDVVMRNILPIHPMAALVLKNIAAAFQSNQRSMFDFIKTPKDLNVKAFQWFIQHTSPLDSRPFLTVDMLWDFFYEKGKDYLPTEIRVILDSYSQQTQLDENEKIVLKAVLIMQAIDLRLGGSLPILKPTEQNLTYAFEGDDQTLANSCRSIATALVSKGVLIHTPIADNKKVYGAAVLAGDNAKIDNHRKEIRANTEKLDSLLSNCALHSSLELTPALKLRFAYTDAQEMLLVTIHSFRKTMDSLKSKPAGWHFYSVLALAKTEEEAQAFIPLIKSVIGQEEYRNITVISALSTPLGISEYDRYVDFAAMAAYYQGNNKQQSLENDRKAKEVLDRGWKNRIRSGQFTIYTYSNVDGETVTGVSAVHAIMQAIVISKYNHVQDFVNGLTETQLKLSTSKQAAKAGIEEEVIGLIRGCESRILGRFWHIPQYWNKPELANESIVIMKKAIDALVLDGFNENGRISIDSIYFFLEDKFGFAPCNMSAFLVGFLLKEYSIDKYRSMDSEGHRDTMTSDKLAEIIANRVGKPNAKSAYIVSLTEEEKAFYEMTEKVWNIAENSCTSPSNAGYIVTERMRGFGYPIWALAEIDRGETYEMVDLYINLVRSKGDDAHSIANEIGKRFMHKKSLYDSMKQLLTVENCKKGMVEYLARFDDGIIWILAKAIGVSQESVLNQVKDVFNIKYAALWEISTGEDEIRKIITEFEVIKHTNTLLNSSARNKTEAFVAWKEALKFIGLSCDALRSKYPELEKLFNILLKIAKNDEILPEGIKQFSAELNAKSLIIKDILSNSTRVFGELYAPYLEGFSDVEIEEIKHSITEDLFVTTTTASNASVKKAAEDFRKKQLRNQLITFWKEKTGTKSPQQWSDKYGTPILVCVAPDEYEDARRTFEIMASTTQNESDIRFALQYLARAKFFESITDARFRDQMFALKILRDYATLFSDLDEVREQLRTVGVQVYNWYDNPYIAQKIVNLASAEYNAGGSDIVLSMINDMSDSELKTWLSSLVKKDIELGVRIIKNKGKKE